MVQSLKLGNEVPSGQSEMKRLNRLPLYIGLGLVALFLAVLVYGLSSRGLHFGGGAGRAAGASASASSFAEQLKRGVRDGIIGEPSSPTVIAHVAPPTPPSEPAREDFPTRDLQTVRGQRLEGEAEWRERLRRESQEQLYREEQRQRLARLQARETARDAPLKVSTAELGNVQMPETAQRANPSAPATDHLSRALQAGLDDTQADQNGQRAKEDFFNADIKALGYLPNGVAQPHSRFELKRGSVIPATLITGISSDLPGRISAQVSQNVYDSATGRQLLIPQGSKLFGRYDSKVSFGQNRVLVVWNDLVFPNGATLQIGNMAGTDARGYGGFKDEVDNHYLKTFGSALLVALIGTGIDMAVPQGSTLATQSSASDAARRNFAESFGRVAEQTVSKNLNVQPTIEIRPGYIFNVLVDQDMVFPSAYAG